MVCLSSKKDLHFGPSFQNHVKFTRKILPRTIYIGQVTSLNYLGFKIYCKNVFFLCANTHHSITTFEVNGMVCNS